MSFPKKLLIIARVPHYRYRGEVYAYTPYAREIDIWADLFEEVSVAGTLLDEAPPGDCSSFARDNVRVLPVSEAGGNGFRAKLSQLVALPRIVWELATYLRKADAVHVRCPCDLGLLGVIMGPMFSRYLIAKYAGQWSPFPGEPLAWRLQRAILRSIWWKGPVTVYSGSSEEPSKVIPFFTSMLTDEQIAGAKIAAAKPRDPKCFRLLFVGRLSAARNVDVLLQAFSTLKLPGRKLECVVVGEGPERAALEKLATSLGIREQTKFLGGLRFEEVLSCYGSANVLVLAAESEGWGKAITEAMAFGCVCIGSDRGIMPKILEEGRGMVVPPRNLEALQNALQHIADHPLEAAKMSKRAAQWAQRFSLDGLRTALRELMVKSWEIEDRGGVIGSVEEGVQGALYNPRSPAASVRR
ncbi:MAG: hypothetical protein JWM68_3655 [Verrucomicrobiales bacterium]|nr:hypothetical protein [Verrucomicrobiales bacterium]